MENCYLEGYFTSENVYGKVMVNTLPFIIGRKPDLELSIEAHSISRRHAEIIDSDGHLCIKDLNSTNGTFLNDNKITESTQINDGDILRLGDIELRVVIEEHNLASSTENMEHTYIATGDSIEKKLIRGIKEFKQLILNKQVKGVLQPIVNNGQSVIAYELLGRGSHPGIPEAPGPLFHIAEHVGEEIALSELFLDVGLLLTRSFPQNSCFFFNVHPKEIKDPNPLYQRLEKIIVDYPNIRLVLEIPEQAVTDIKQMHDIKKHLHKLKIGLAFDDFGSGQARLLELADVSPDIVKFDICLIHDIDTANPARQRMIEMLVNFSHEHGIKVLAEGVETAEEDVVCRQMGFDMIQGFYYGRGV